MSTVSDDRRIRKLPVTTSAAERASIDLAITLWQARHGQSQGINENLRGSILAAICDVWREAEIRAIRGE
jgi:hypothetical protein